MKGLMKLLWGGMVAFILLAVLMLSMMVSCEKEPVATPVPSLDGLTAEQVHVLYLKGTDVPFTHHLTRETRAGVYVSWITGDVLFRSEQKRQRGHGWPDFIIGTDKVSNRWDSDGSARMETIETANETHLGHYLYNERQDYWYYCINGTALNFIPN